MVHWGKGRVPQRKNETNFRIPLEIDPEGGDTISWFDKNGVKYFASAEVQVGRNPPYIDGETQDLGIQSNWPSGQRPPSHRFCLHVILPPHGQTTIVWNDGNGLHYTAVVDVRVELCMQTEFILHQLLTNPEDFHDFFESLGFSRDSLPRNPEEALDSAEIDKWIADYLKRRKRAGIFY